MFEVAYETTFCATHVLHDGGQPIEPQHGHDWRVEVVAAGESLDSLGVVVDFEHLKKAVGEICRRFHYADITSHPDHPITVGEPHTTRCSIDGHREPTGEPHLWRVGIAVFDSRRVGQELPHCDRHLWMLRVSNRER